MYTVTRQVQWPDGLEVVEVSQGGLDYANPGMLTPRYPSEGETFPNPRDAAAVAIDICRQWRRDGHKKARVAYGATMGMTLPFSPCTFQELRQWAERRYQILVITLPSCESCGATIWDPKDAWWSADYEGLQPEMHGGYLCSRGEPGRRPSGPQKSNCLACQGVMA